MSGCRVVFGRECRCMIRQLTFACMLVASLFGDLTLAATIRVPADQPSIQAGINAASNGDTVLVAPGTYTENINFNGKAITLKSSGGATVTIIDGGGIAPVVTFAKNETSSSVVSGFTIQHGTSTFNSQYEGGGVYISFASPTIKNNIIQNNSACSDGGGIAVNSGSPLIQRNTIRNNSQSGCSGGSGGGGISVGSGGTAQIVGNLIQDNSWNNEGAGAGGGISLDSSVSTVIENNIIQGNNAGTSGAAISMINDVSGTTIVQNLITGNSSPDDAGIFWSNPPAALVNNTITDGGAATGSSTSIVVANAMNSSIVIANNIIVSSNIATNAFYCDFNSITTPSNFYNNDVYSTKGTAYAGMCGDQTGVNGNLSLSPDFVSSNNFRLKGGSPAIDAGNNSAPDLPSTDLAGNPRIINGNGGPTAIVDMGAYEFIPVTPTISLVSSLNPSVTGQTVTFTAAVTAQSGTLTGTVTFTISGNKPVTVPLTNGQAQFPWTFANSGPRTVTAAYSGDESHLPGLSAHINQVVELPIVAITGSPQQPLNQNGDYVAQVTITNSGNITITSLQVTKAGTILGSGSVLSAPATPVMNLAPGASAVVTLTFPASSAPAGATTAPLRVSGTYTVSSPSPSGNWSLSFRSVTL